jgi:predicted ATPase
MMRIDIARSTMANHITSVELQHEKYPTREHYPFSLPIFHQTRKLEFEKPVTMFVGENGTGKSTLLEALARICGIHIWRLSSDVRMQYNPYENLMHRCLSLEWANGKVPGGFFGSAIFNDFANILEEWAKTDPGQLEYFGGKSLLTMSHGQSLMSYFRARYKIKGIYFLDEPETALSPKRQIELLELIGENVHAGHAQFVIATHSPILLACKNAKIYSFDHTPVRVLNYEETEHFQVYRDFMADWQKYVS